jgi:hypothetical protein
VLAEFLRAVQDAVVALLLPLRCRVPEHNDPPLSPVQQAELACAWPHILSSYLREDHIR